MSFPGGTVAAPAGELAAVPGVNRNTMLRALRLLREEGLLDFRRGPGITITITTTPSTPPC